ncbi:hypothetical protein P171DRAFT_26847 [Karstenula rhodostoma CBS 690.94]|uniref:Uncharacterized protein n=1 Tax=Karstenula rhodostoma CBS 690.94 TaxID=1392251 RepID=A0A9P4PJS3_9PLEO|nr:hypothetical protein P171DRAFT_26847 [Karstenula rhodostoma CBS 690.94]
MSASSDIETERPTGGLDTVVSDRHSPRPPKRSHSESPTLTPGPDTEFEGVDLIFRPALRQCTSDGGSWSLLSAGSEGLPSEAAESTGAETIATLTEDNLAAFEDTCARPDDIERYSNSSFQRPSIHSWARTSRPAISWRTITSASMWMIRNRPIS